MPRFDRITVDPKAPGSSRSVGKRVVSLIACQGGLNRIGNEGKR
jgi:hypothetical protein